jgi:hypothetical protein
MHDDAHRGTTHYCLPHTRFGSSDASRQSIVLPHEQSVQAGQPGVLVRPQVTREEQLSVRQHMSIVGVGQAIGVQWQQITGACFQATALSTHNTAPRHDTFTLFLEFVHCHDNQYRRMPRPDFPSTALFCSQATVFNNHTHGTSAKPNQLDLELSQSCCSSSTVTVHDIAVDE